RDRVPQPHRTFGGRNADALVALAPEKLGALVGVVAQSSQDRPRSSQQAVLTGRCGQLAAAGTKDVSTLHVPCDQAVVLEGDRKPMCSGTGQSGGSDQLRQRRWPGLEGAQNDRGLVKNADSARVVHALILPSQSLRRKFTV
ncbi:MAG: hypothetical protein QOF35_1515, partial [Actinomycetota bacterium]|nr:hypothetical protein [Actinomycetota bacterium]